MSAANGIIITDAGKHIGLGHLVRSITLVEAFKKVNESVVVHVLSNDYSLRALSPSCIEQKNILQTKKRYAFAIVDLPYHMPTSIWKFCQENVDYLMTIDDKFESRDKVDAVVDALMVPSIKHSLIHSNDTQYFYGLDYLLLRDTIVSQKPLEFSEKPLTTTFLLGDEFTDYACQVSRNLEEVYSDMTFNVICHKLPKTLDNSCFLESKINIFVNPKNIAEILNQSRWVVCKLGITTFETLYFGGRVIQIEPSLAHVNLSRDLLDYYPGLGFYSIGHVNELLSSDAAKLIMEHIDSDSGANSIRIDGKGSQRIANEILGL